MNSSSEAADPQVRGVAAGGRPGDRPEPSSFRDPAGFVFQREGRLLRQVNPPGAAAYDLLMASGLYRSLTEQGLLVPHREVEVAPATAGAHRILEPERIPFISYPYEWSFTQLRAAALLTLRIQRQALELGMTLKDASAYNVQFLGTRPVFIDTLSFAPFSGRPWVAYGQFCRHFLAPLALASYRDARLMGLLRNHLDGVPLGLAASLLPLRARWRPGLALHLVAHARSEARHQSAVVDKARVLPVRAHLGMLESLEGTVRGLTWRHPASTWGNYDASESYSPQALAAKREAVLRLAQRVAPGVAWDLGANDGAFARLLAEAGHTVVAMDFDPVAVDRAASREGPILPLLMDLSNPSSGAGFAGEERYPLLARGPADLAVALALVHHLAITHHLSLRQIVEFLARCGRHVLVEFIPPDDPQVQRLLRNRDERAGAHDGAEFVAGLKERFQIVAEEPLPESGRHLFLVRRVGD